MSNHLERSFSFNDNDEPSLSSDRQEEVGNHYTHSQDPFSPPQQTLPRPTSKYSSPQRSTNTQYPDVYADTRPPLPRASISRRPLPSQVLNAYQSNPPPRPQQPVVQTFDLLPTRTTSTTTPGTDNLGTSAAGGGIAGVAFGVANTHGRESGLQALRDIDETRSHHSASPSESEFDTMQGSDTPYIPEPPYRSRDLQEDSMHNSNTERLAPPPIPPHRTPSPQRGGNETPSRPQYSGLDQYSSERISPYNYPPVPDPGTLQQRYGLPEPAPYPAQRSLHPGYAPVPNADVIQQVHSNPFDDSPYSRYSSPYSSRLDQQADFDPNDIADDGDDVMAQPVRRKSFLGIGQSSSTSIPKTSATAAGAAAGGGFMDGIASVTRKAVSRDTSGAYDPVHTNAQPQNEKSGFLASESNSRNKRRWILIALIALLAVGIIVGAVVGGIIASRKSSSPSSPSSATNGTGQSAAQDDGSGDLDINSSEIKKLLNNQDLHKVFPGMDYTPYNTQYPACLSYPPSQNNVTRDMAVLGQLTNAVRLYGTDCNQTQMVLHAIDKLQLKDMKVWLGVWIGNNETTNSRQMSAMWDILGQYGADPFKGLIVGNEVLFRKDQTEANLSSILTGVKTNLTSMKIDLLVATSDLGTDWTATLAESVDIVMSNIHPFFGGVPVAQAASWTWTFWDTHDNILTQDTSKQNLISEVGWPSDGGNDCGGDDVKCPDAKSGSVAGIDEMNSFMGDWVCQSLANGTDYFWYVACCRFLIELSSHMIMLIQVTGSKPLTSLGRLYTIRRQRGGRINGVCWILGRGR